MSPEQAPNEAEYLDIEYEKGDIVALNGKRMGAAEVLTELNRLGVEVRYMAFPCQGMGSQGANTLTSVWCA